jgi:hypothetical protein
MRPGGRRLWGGHELVWLATPHMLGFRPRGSRARAYNAGRFALRGFACVLA